MRFTGALLVGSLVIGASASIRAQTNNCPAPGAPGSITAVTEDACWKGADIFAYMLPQLGNGIAGGNTTPGQGGSLGGFPHFARVEIALALATLACLPATSLALQKCISASGAVTYSEQLCPGGSKSQSVGGDAAIPGV